MFLIIGVSGEPVATALQETSHIILLALFVVLEICSYVNGTT
jgi:hypothetical protein